MPISVHDQIIASRNRFFAQHGDYPTRLLLGYVAATRLHEHIVARMPIDSVNGAEYCGMLIDVGCVYPTAVEVR